MLKKKKKKKVESDGLQTKKTVENESPKKKGNSTFSAVKRFVRVKSGQAKVHPIISSPK